MSTKRQGNILENSHMVLKLIFHFTTDVGIWGFLLFVEHQHNFNN